MQASHCHLLARMRLDGIQVELIRVMLDGLTTMIVDLAILFLLRLVDVEVVWE